MNVEQTIIRALAAKGYSAYADVPNPMPDSFVTVERTGGGDRDKVDRPMLAVQAWAQGRKAAAELADAVRCDLESLCGSDGLGAVRVTSIYNWPDMESRRARYQLTVEAAAHI